MVVRQGMTLAGVGVLLGLGLAAGATRLMSSVLFGVGPADPATFASVGVGLLLVAAAATLRASYVKVRRNILRLREMKFDVNACERAICSVSLTI